jgi:hypothetical protein
MASATKAAVPPQQPPVQRLVPGGTASPPKMATNAAQRLSVSPLQRVRTASTGTAPNGRRAGVTNPGKSKTQDSTPTKDANKLTTGSMGTANWMRTSLGFSPLSPAKPLRKR